MLENLKEAVPMSGGGVRKPVGKIPTLLATLPREDAAALQAALENPAWTAEALSRTLRQCGIAVSASTIKLWRRNRAAEKATQC